LLLPFPFGHWNLFIGHYLVIVSWLLVIFLKGYGG